jgi:hypothetical protein
MALAQIILFLQRLKLQIFKILFEDLIYWKNCLKILWNTCGILQFKNETINHIVYLKNTTS